MSESKGLFVRGFDCKLQDMELVAMFEPCPGFVAARIRRNPQGVALGFVDFLTPEQCKAAYDLATRFFDGTSATVEFSHPRAAPARTAQRAVRPEDAPPTLYVSNIPRDATQREIAHIFRRCNGFSGIRFVKRKPPAPFASRHHVFPFYCFVEFDTNDSAKAALGETNGYIMDLNDPNSQCLSVSFAQQLK